MLGLLASTRAWVIGFCIAGGLLGLADVIRSKAQSLVAWGVVLLALGVLVLVH